MAEIIGLSGISFLNRVIKRLKHFAEAAGIQTHLIPTVAIPPRIYGLPKIHKKEIPLRPIISAIGGPAHRIAAILNKRLSGLWGKNEHFIRNSQDFIMKIRALKLDKHDLLISCDVESLFTRVPVTQACQIIEDRLLVSNISAQDAVNTANAIRAVMNTTYFQFRGDFYEQTEGAAMGSPLSPTVANIFMEHFEELALRTAKLKPKLWLRYVDDTFVVWPHGKETITEFIKHLNGIEQSIKFTWEMENGRKLPFLDVWVQRNTNGKLSTSVYRKPTCSDMYLSADSCNPRNQKDSVLRTLVLRAVSHSSNKRRLKNELEHLNMVATLNGYSREQVTRNLKWARKINSRNKNGAPPKDQTTRKVVLPFHPKVSYQIAGVLRKAGMEVAFKPPRKLKSFLPNVKDRVLNCNKPGVYAIPCACGTQYIGETKRSVNTRIKEHKKCLEKCEWDKSAIAMHHKDTKHHIRWEDTKIVAQDSNKFALRFKEALAIRCMENCNQDRGAEIPKVWVEALRNEFDASKWSKAFQPVETKQTTRSHANRIKSRESKTNSSQVHGVTTIQAAGGIISQALGIMANQEAESADAPRRSERIKRKASQSLVFQS